MKFSIEKIASLIQAGKLAFLKKYHIIYNVTEALKENLRKLTHSRMEAGASAMASLFNLPDSVKVVMTNGLSKTIYEGQANILRGDYGTVMAYIPKITELDQKKLLALADYLILDSSPLICDLDTANILAQDDNSNLWFIGLNLEPGIYPMGLLTRQRNGKTTSPLEMYVTN